MAKSHEKHATCPICSETIGTAHSQNFEEVSYCTSLRCLPRNYTCIHGRTCVGKNKSQHATKFVSKPKKLTQKYKNKHYKKEGLSMRAAIEDEVAKLEAAA